MATFAGMYPPLYFNRVGRREPATSPEHLADVMIDYRKWGTKLRS